MPVQINELVIRANVIEQGDAGQQPSTAQSSAVNINKTEIIQECVDIILEVLKNKKER
jgi:hypothetical protein